jgi:hypothetical protein
MSKKLCKVKISMFGKKLKNISLFFCTKKEGQNAFLEKNLKIKLFLRSSF